MKDEAMEESALFFDKFCLFVEPSPAAVQEVAGRAVMGVGCGS